MCFPQEVAFCLLSLSQKLYSLLKISFLPFEANGSYFIEEIEAIGS